MLKINKSVKLIMLIVITVGLVSCVNEEKALIEEINVKEIKKEKVRKEKGEITISIAPPKTFNPLKNEDIYVNNMLEILFEPLFELDENYRPKPILVESFTSNYTDNTTTIKLKEGLKWSNGTDITSDDIIYSLEVIKNASEKSMYKNMVRDVVSAKKEDELQVTIQYGTPKMLIGYDLLFPIISKEYYSKKGVDLKPMGNGKYKFVDLNKSREYLLERDKSKEISGNIEKINVIVIQDSATMLYSFEQNKTDVIISSFEDWNKYNMSKESNSYNFYNQEFEFIGMNFDRILLQDKNLRILLDMLTNEEELLSKVYLNDGGITKTPVNPKSFLYNENVKDYGSDINIINDIIKENFTTEEKNGIKKLYTDINGLKKEIILSLIVNEENELRIKVSEYLKKTMKKFGIEIEISKLPYSEYLERINVGNYDLFLGGYKSEANQDITPLFGVIDNGEFGNVFNYKINNIEERVYAVRNARGEEQYKVALEQLQKLIAEEIIIINTVYKKDMMLTSSTIKNNEHISYSNQFGSIDKLVMYEYK